jgi:hypothetical protein
VAITLTLGIIVPLTKGIIYLNAWAIVYYSVTGSPEPLDNNNNSSHAFSFTQVLTAYFWETVSSKKVVYEYP